MVGRVLLDPPYAWLEAAPDGKPNLMDAMESGMFRTHGAPMIRLDRIVRDGSVVSPNSNGTAKPVQTDDQPMKTRRKR
jgi:hypothetical protein